MDFSDLTDDALTGGFRVFQRRRGHRYSLDDVLTAHEALHLPGQTPQRCLDLGCGLGSVLLMLAYKWANAELVGIEAQAQSYALAARNVERNRVSARVRLLHGDLRDAQLIAQACPPFELVTGTPPYKSASSGTISPDSQRAHARVELRGGVEDYLQAAALAVADGGWVVVCAEASRPQRVHAGAAAAGLHVHQVTHAVPSPHKPALFSVWSLRRSPCSAVETRTFLARDSQGQRSPAYREVRAFFDLSSSVTEVASPVQRPRNQQPMRGSID